MALLKGLPLRFLVWRLLTARTPWARMQPVLLANILVIAYDGAP